MWSAMDLHSGVSAEWEQHPFAPLGDRAKFLAQPYRQRGWEVVLCLEGRWSRSPRAAPSSPQRKGGVKAAAARAQSSLVSLGRLLPLRLDVEARHRELRKVVHWGMIWSLGSQAGPFGMCAREGRPRRAPALLSVDGEGPEGSQRAKPLCFRDGCLVEGSRGSLFS